VWQLIGAYAGLREPESAVDYCEAHFGDDVRGRRFRAAALIADGRLEPAAELIGPDPDDAVLVELRGNLHKARGDYAAALTDWRRALELDPGNFSPLYSIGFLLERLSRS
jgi:tetratricopeptide (TPR) repeat protein